MIRLNDPSREISKQRDRMKHIRGGFEKAFVRAAKRVATQGRTEVSKSIREHVAIKAKDLKPVLLIGRNKKGASLTLKESQRLSLRYFNAKQNNKGVSYKMSKKSGRGFIPGGFQGPRPGLMKASWKGNVFKRVGKARLPIQKLMGVSAWGAFLGSKMYRPTEKMLRRKFSERLKHEVNFLINRGRTRG